MQLNILNRFLNKVIAKQLRRPVGILAGKVGKEMNISNRTLYDFTIREMQLKDNDSILEIGFGNGKFFDKIFSTANNLKISGIDFSDRMVKAANANNPTACLSGNLTLRSGSSDSIPFPDNSFDKVFCINVIYFWEDSVAHLSEIYRVLKPGGRLYTSIRTKEIMEHLPFTKYGFKLYSQDQWVSTLEANLLHLVNARKTQDEPDAVINKVHYKVESLCIVAEKKG